MRFTFAIVGILVSQFSVASFANAQVLPPYLGIVSIAEVTLRAGPGDQMPETGSLPAGEPLIVVQEEGERWLGIKPPSGQVSWIKNRFLSNDGVTSPTMRTPRNAVVVSDGEVEIAAGRPGEPKPLQVRRTRVPDGTIVVVVGERVQINNEAWVPILPPPGDLRYVPKSAVQFDRSVALQSYKVNTPEKRFSAQGEPTPSAGTGLPLADQARPGRQAPGQTVGRTRGNRWPNDPLWLEAEAAEREGNYDRAERLYLQLAANHNRDGGDQELVQLCFDRVHEVTKRANARQARGETKPATPPGASPGPNTGNRPDDDQPAWYGPGELRLAGFKFDDRLTYALVDRSGKVRAYVHKQAGVDLQNQLGRDVQLYGTVSHPKDLRGMPLITASRVQDVTRTRP